MALNKNSELKNKGVVFTPSWVVKLMLDEIGYKGEKIYKKSIIDNSAGNGNFIVEIVKRFIDYYKENNLLNDLKKDLEKYIFAIEINKEYFEILKNRCDSLVEKYVAGKVNWNFLLGDSLKISNSFNNSMDYVVGNPPYVRVHNLSDLEDNKKFRFTSKGMIDLYLIFYDIGMNMMNQDGKLCYISPSSWWTSIAGSNFRNYLIDNKLLRKIIDFHHLPIFKKVSSYTEITVLDKSLKTSYVSFRKYPNKEFLIPYKNILIDGKFYFSSDNDKLKEILNFNKKSIFEVKNGFATLDDSFYIKEKFSENISPQIDVIKASTGEWKKCFYPYDESGKLLNTNLLNNETIDYLKNHKYGFGRTQGLKDTYKNKISISTLLGEKLQLKINFVPKGSGVYSGLYILTSMDFDDVKNALYSKDFYWYISSLKKYKNAGCYTFSSKDVSLFLNYYFQNERF